MGTVLLWLFVLNLGIAFGAGLYEHRINIPRWLTDTGAPHWNAGAAQQDDVGRRFWVLVTTIPLTLLTIANLIAAWPMAGVLRTWWLAAAAASLLERVFTFAYFVPAMIGLMGADDSPASVNRARRWRRLNCVRHVISLAAWLAALMAFAVAHAGRGIAI